MHTTAETALQESQTYTRNNSRELPPQHKLVYSQCIIQLNSTELREPCIPLSSSSHAHLMSQKTCTCILWRWANFAWRKLSCHHYTDQLVCLQQAVPIHWQAMGQLKCPTPKKSTAKITTNILRPHIPLMQGQWSQPRLDEWRTNQLATASPWIMDACRARHTSCSAQDDKRASKTQPRKRKHGNFFKIIFTRGPPDTPENMVSPARI